MFDLISHSLELGQIPGVQFAGYAALQSMAQNGLLRACVDTVADDMTRSWIKLKRTGGETGQTAESRAETEKPFRPNPQDTELNKTPRKKEPCES